MNIALRQFREDMIKLVNSAPLPIEAKRLVACEVLHKIESQADMEIAREIHERSNQSSEETKEE